MLHCCDLWTLCFCFRDVMSLGISLVGHQKKIMSSIQTMRAQMLHLHGTGIQVWWRSKALPGRMNQNSPGNTVKCVTRQKIWKNKSTTKKKKTFHTLPVRLTFQNWQNRIIPLLLAKDFGTGAGNQETERQWKSKHARERERERILHGRSSGCSKELLTSLSWSVWKAFYALYGLYRHKRLICS